MKKYSAFLIGLGSVAVIGAAWWLIRNNTKVRREEKPPKHAPQLDIENPGTQDEFITAASESGLG